MSIRHRGFPAVSVLLVILAAVLSACAVGSGFIGGDLEFVRSDTKGVYVYTRPGIDPARYKSLLMDEFSVEYHEDAATELFGPAKRKDLANLLRHEVERQVRLRGRYPRASGEGPGVVRLRAAVTGLYPRYSYFFYQPHETDRLRAIGLDRAIFEAEFVDSVTGETIAAVVDKRDGDEVAKILSARIKREVTPSDVLGFWGDVVRVRLDATFRPGSPGR